MNIFVLFLPGFFASPLYFTNQYIVPISLTSISIDQRTLTEKDFIPLNLFTLDKRQPPQPFNFLFLGKKVVHCNLQIPFTENKNVKLFRLKTDNQTFPLLIDTIKNNYSFKFIVDDLVRFCPFGVINENGQVQYYSNFHFDLYYNGNYVIKYDVTPQKLMDLLQKHNLKITATAEWHSSTVTVNNRLELFVSDTFSNIKIHIYSLIQLIFQIVVISIIIYLIYQQMMADFNFSQSMVDFDDFEVKTKDRGWKMLHGDIFRNPSNSILLTIFVGSGSNLFLTMLLLLISCCCVNIEYAKDNFLYFGIFFYVISSIFSGFFTTTLSNIFGERKWLRSVLGAAYFFPVFGELFLVIGNFFGGRSFFFTPIFVILLILLVPVLILSILGSIYSIRKRLFTKLPCEIALVPRQIPKLPWYLNGWFVCLIVGIFISISFITELFYILHSFFLSHVYNLYTYLTLTFLFIFVLSGLSTIIIIYFRLQAESYKWQWISFLAPMTSGLFVWIYCIIFYYYYSLGFTVAQFLSYLFKTLIISFVFGLVNGFGGYVGATAFIRVTFSNLKLD
ncbi:Transmembrane 9 superfamily member 3 [Tritrichomonas foetus]|uniref:Transmembrane 9 superfamily member n=1 Tax=Tritrichomonas foetus TaxID=1144522 RepID=A0A1J4JGJ7_9EUKA|nr:Transmembrane 9 superfamily member 3 [Tritrichomonas foetus]|eukprot:OHS97793.1 Transmembrane 9 superfamily member 3 [Tritrichomonas foetus]